MSIIKFLWKNLKHDNDQANSCCACIFGLGSKRFSPCSGVVTANYSTHGNDWARAEFRWKRRKIATCTGKGWHWIYCRRWKRCWSAASISYLAVFVVVACIVVHGGLIEWVQPLVNRHGELADFFANCAGVFLGVGIMLSMTWLGGRLRNR